MKFSLTKQVNKETLVELFMMLSDSIDENIPDIIWEGSEFEVDLKQDKVKCDINYISTKKGGEFSIAISWITPAAKKQKAAEAEKKARERLAKGAAKTTSKAKSTTPPKPIEVISDEELWLEEGDNVYTGGDDTDWDTDDDDEW